MTRELVYFPAALVVYFYSALDRQGRGHVQTRAESWGELLIRTNAELPLNTVAGVRGFVALLTIPAWSFVLRGYSKDGLRNIPQR